MKRVHKVFLFVAVLVLVFLVWAGVFNDGGVFESVWNGIAGVVNNTWETVTGSSDGILPTLDDAGVETEGQNLNNVDNDF